MAYNITLTNGTPLVTVADGSINPDTTSLTLVGKNYAGYGQFLNENFVKLLENFAQNTPPTSPLQGQLWWDSGQKLLKVKSGNLWKTVSSSTSSATAPQTPSIGDLWWDSGNTQLNVWGGASWVIIGPAYTASQGQTGVVADTVLEGISGTPHIIVKFFVKNIVVAVLSKDPSFNTAMQGFSTINPGFNLSTGVSGLPNFGYYGDANNALNLGGFAASEYLRGTAASNTGYPITIASNGASQTNGALNIGLANDFGINVTPTAVNLSSNTNTKDLKLWVNVGNIPKDLLTLNGSTGTISVLADPTTAMGIATKQYADNLVGAGGPTLMHNGSNQITGTITPASNAVYNLGSGAATFLNIFATSFRGTADNSLALGGVAAANFVRTDVPSSITSQLNVMTDAGIAIGAAGDFVIDITSSPNSVNLKSITNGKGVNLITNVSGVPTTVLAVSNTGAVTLNANPTTNLGVATKQYVDNTVSGSSINLISLTNSLIPNANNLYNIGSGVAKWNTVYATTFNGNATTANYADLAERFEADAEYTPGTVVELGGVAEITAAMSDLSENVFGVISTRAAYLMNSGAGTDLTHPPIAMQGRVPVRVTGKIKKGDRLVSAGNGLARAASRSEITSFNVIGRSLEAKTTNGEGTVEAIVKLNS